MGRGSDKTAGNERFDTTRWTLVVAANQGTPAAQAALEHLCRSYWYPLYAFLRRRGHSPDESEDLVQSFFARLIDKSDLAAADPNRGRFRSFLVSSLQHFAANQRDHDRAAKRGGGSVPMSLDFSGAEARYHHEPATEMTPERLFDRRWALDLLDRVLAKLQDEYDQADKRRLFEAISPFLTGMLPGETHEAAAKKLGMSTDAMKMAVHRLRKQYKQLLRGIIADTVESPEDVEDEIQHLFAALKS